MDGTIAVRASGAAEPSGETGRHEGDLPALREKRTAPYWDAHWKLLEERARQYLGEVDPQFFDETFGAAWRRVQ